MESESPERPSTNDQSQVTLSGQLPHRGVNEVTHGADTDFPEPGESPEHTGQHS